MTLEIILLAIPVVSGLAIIGAVIRNSRKYGEDCRGYPYNCPCCPRAARCIIEIGRKDDDA
ncbi:hypothetical protein [Enterocloster clostridioformis]|uniref:hypothetical protein n=1 Tax=Enterocloster clostridioformis TaxID=1531 RepID=UPI0018AA1F22|nr:hypothetical protein [Enterocloster clostridioformis]MDB2127471.1 hypothetical protein [Enterocloster clostridioformis]